MDLTNFYKSLEVMGQGMAGILIFMSLFYILIIGLEKAFPVEKKEQ